MTGPHEVSPRGGPWLNAALLCEQVLEERDGTLSAIRIIDRLTIHSAGQNIPAEMPAQRVSQKALLVFRSGSAKGKETVEVLVEDPRGIKGPSRLQSDIFLPGEDAGANLVVDLLLEIEHEGVSWVDVSVGGRLLTRMPLRVVYSRLSVSRSGGSE